jgi:hypothetical protein
MFLAGVRCEACHNRPQGDHRAANEVSCMACHGPTYLTIYRSWQAGLTQRVDGLRNELRTAAARLEAGDGTGAQALADATANLALVERGKAIHNPGYSLGILEKAHQDIVAALAAAGEAQPPTAPWVSAPYQIECLKCHFGVELLQGPAFGTTFPHTPHVTTARLRCTVCHGDLAAHGTLRLEAQDCQRCHERIKHSMADVSAEECLGCHTADIGSVSDKVRFPHEKHISAGLDCALCHAGVGDRPHREFARSGEALPTIGHGFCGTCHAGDVPAPDGSPPDDANCQLCHTSF